MSVLYNLLLRENTAKGLELSKADTYKVLIAMTIHISRL